MRTKSIELEAWDCLNCFGSVWLCVLSVKNFFTASPEVLPKGNDALCGVTVGLAMWEACLVCLVIFFLQIKAVS